VSEPDRFVQSLLSSNSLIPSIYAPNLELPNPRLNPTSHAHTPTTNQCCTQITNLTLPPTGRDPSGNTYYELRQPRGDAPQGAPFRRLVHYPRSTPYSEVRVPPAWHQWLRHQRGEPPSMAEQVAELQRQARIKVLAAEADARWEAKGSLLDMPPSTATTTAAEGGRQTREQEQAQVQETEQTSQQGEPEEPPRRDGREKDIPAKQTSSPKTEPPPSSPDPWKRAQRGAPGETWQPEGWTPTPARKR
jgi:NADH dehydrogenase [ubiquinone] 1 alpha subcomplex assembly factor 2